MQATEHMPLRNLILNLSLDFAVTSDQKLFLVDCLKNKSVQLDSGNSHSLSKTQRYRIIRQIFRSTTRPL